MFDHPDTVAVFQSLSHLLEEVGVAIVYHKHVDVHDQSFMMLKVCVFLLSDQKCLHVLCACILTNRQEAANGLIGISKLNMLLT